MSTYKFNPFTNKLDRVNNGATAVELTDATAISNITNESNWTTGEYAGSTSGLSDGNYYLDTTLNYIYHYYGTTLTRTTYNDV